MNEKIEWREWLKEWSSEIYPEDEELLLSVEAGIGILDGVMSPQTRALMHHFRCTGVDMKALWSYTPMSWTCPACNRTKPEIVRPNKNGELMCHLVEHHDHMKDLLIKRFQSISAGLERVVATEAADQFAKRSAPMVSAYDNTAICVDCNNADTAAKRIAKTHEFFSFSPNEIYAFSITSPNREHRINPRIAIELWEKNRPTFERRVDIVEQIAEIAAKNEHWYQSMPFQYHPNHIRKTASNIAQSKRSWYALRVLCGPTQKQPEQDPSSWRTKEVFERWKKPSRGDIEHVAKVTSRKKWDSVPADWHCPSCKRSKEQIVRPTHQSAWALPISSKYYRDTRSDCGYSTQVACDDCGHAAINIVKEAVAIAEVGVETYSRHIGLDELAKIVIPRAHGHHRFANDKANALVNEISKRLKNGDNQQLKLL